MTSVVVTGRRMKSSERFMSVLASAAFSAARISTFAARHEAQLAVGDDALPRREPLRDHHGPSATLPRRPSPGRDSTVLSALTTKT